LLVLEYKGEHLRSVPKEIEKDQVGRLWAAHSGGRCRFAFVFKQRDGASLATQIVAALA
jgi:hypothetical protein